MIPFRAAAFRKPDFWMIILNNFLLLLGMLLFGWTFFDTLFLYWLEPLAAIIVCVYLNILVPFRYDPPAVRRRDTFRRKLGLTILLTIYTLVIGYIALVGIIDICQVKGWDTSQGVLHTLGQLPLQLWNGDLLLLTALFLLFFLLPPLLLERQGVRPVEERLPMQTRLLIHPAQFIANFVWLGIVYFCYQNGWTNEILLVAILGICKSVFETIIYLRLDWQSF